MTCRLEYRTSHYPQITQRSIAATIDDQKENREWTRMNTNCTDRFVSIGVHSWLENSSPNCANFNLSITDYTDFFSYRDVELKALTKVGEIEWAQVLNYLKASSHLARKNHAQFAATPLLRAR